MDLRCVLGCLHVLLCFWFHCRVPWPISIPHHSPADLLVFSLKGQFPSLCSHYSGSIPGTQYFSNQLEKCLRECYCHLDCNCIRSTDLFGGELASSWSWNLYPWRGDKNVVIFNAFPWNLITAFIQVLHISSYVQVIYMPILLLQMPHFKIVVVYRICNEFLHIALVLYINLINFPLSIQWIIWHFICRQSWFLNNDSFVSYLPNPYSSLSLNPIYLSVCLSRHVGTFLCPYVFLSKLGHTINLWKEVMLMGVFILFPF